MRWSSTFSTLLLLSSTPTSIDAFLSRPMPISNGSFTRNGGASVQMATNDIEPYVGPVGSISDMEGGIAVGEDSDQVMMKIALCF